MGLAQRPRTGLVLYSSFVFPSGSLLTSGLLLLLYSPHDVGEAPVAALVAERKRRRNRNAEAEPGDEA